MKPIYYLKASAVALLVFFTMNVNAARIQVSGTDTDLAAALALANTGDELVINGFIEMSAPVTITKNVTFVGTDPGVDGFEAPLGGVSTKLFEFTPEVVEGAKLQFLNLGFYGANNTTVGDDGGVGRILNGTTEFRNCIFDGNKTVGRGGALYLANPAAGGPAVANFFGCTISANTAGTTGGAIFIAGDFITSFDHCMIKENSSPNDRGGAFFIEGNGQHRFYYSVIKSNTSGVAGALDAGEKGGAAFVTAGGAAITVESSAIVSNIAYGNHGAAFFVMGNPNITLINSTVANNATKAGAGGWFIASNNVDITLVNSFNINNTGTNSGNAGGGFRVMNLGNRINFFNSVVAGNTCDNSEGAVDMGYSNTPDIASTLVIKNSIVGLIGGIDASAIPAAVDKAGINPSLVNEYNLGGQTAQVDWATLDQSGIDFVDGLQATSGFGMPFYTLTSADVYAAKMGDPALLANYDVNTDLFNVVRKVTGGAIFAGPVQSVVEYAPDVLDPQTGVITPKVQKNSNAIRVIGSVSNGILGVDFGNLNGRAKGELISMTGQVVENVFNLNVVGKGYYNVKTTAQGIYILRVTMNGNAYTTPVILN